LVPRPPCFNALVRRRLLSSLVDLPTCSQQQLVVNQSRGILVMARNVIGVTGIGLLSSLVTGGLLAWILPMAYIAFAEYAFLQSWTNPWTWPV
jgi:hypothetical protein